MLRLLDECRGVAAAEGFAPQAGIPRRCSPTLTEAGSTFTASMLRDIENGAPIEADHIIGDLLRRGRRHPSAESGLSILPIVYTHLKAYEARRARLARAG